MPPSSYGTAVDAMRGRPLVFVANLFRKTIEVPWLGVFPNNRIRLHIMVLEYPAEAGLEEEGR